MSSHVPPTMRVPCSTTVDPGTVVRTSPPATRSPPAVCCMLRIPGSTGVESVLYVDTPASGDALPGVRPPPPLPPYASGEAEPPRPTPPTPSPPCPGSLSCKMSNPVCGSSRTALHVRPTRSFFPHSSTPFSCRPSVACLLVAKFQYNSFPSTSLHEVHVTRAEAGAWSRCPAPARSS